MTAAPLRAPGTPGKRPRPSGRGGARPERGRRPLRAQPPEDLRISHGRRTLNCRAESPRLPGRGFGCSTPAPCSCERRASSLRAWASNGPSWGLPGRTRDIHAGGEHLQCASLISPLETLECPPEPVIPGCAVCAPSLRVTAAPLRSQRLSRLTQNAGLPFAPGRSPQQQWRPCFESFQTGVQTPRARHHDARDAARELRQALCGKLAQQALPNDKLPTRMRGCGRCVRRLREVPLGASRRAQHHRALHPDSGHVHCKTQAPSAPPDVRIGPTLKPGGRDQKLRVRRLEEDQVDREPPPPGSGYERQDATTCKTLRAGGCPGSRGAASRPETWPHARPSRGKDSPSRTAGLQSASSVLHQSRAATRTWHSRE